MKKNFFIGLGALVICGALICLSGCDNKINFFNFTQQEQNVQTENIKITIDSKYTITTDKEFYKPSIRIAKSADEYISVQQLKDGNEKLKLPTDGSYTAAQLAEDFQNYTSNLTGFSPVSSVTFGGKAACKTTTSVNGVKSDIYRVLTDNNNVYKVVVSGPEFKNSEEVEKIIKNLVLE